VLVSNLKYDVTDAEELRELFMTVGEVVDAQVSLFVLCTRKEAWGVMHAPAVRAPSIDLWGGDARCL